MRRVLFTLLISLITTFASAQSGSGLGTVTLRVLDAETATTIPGAIIELSSESNPDRKLYFSTEGNGEARMVQQPYGDYKIKVTYLGYDDVESYFSLQAPAMALQDINIMQSSLQIDAVVKEIQAIRTSQKGDTLSYNANSFKVSADSDVEGLMKKMPGITIEGGSITAQGETIKKIYVDGREFFADDVATALKSLPAEVVEKIELYGKSSDEAESTGVDDGNQVKAINIITKPSMRKGIFGKVYAGYGYEPDPSEVSDKHKYISGGNVNFFRDKQRLSVIGFANNINQKNFSFEDIVGSSEDGSNDGDYSVSHPSGVADIAAIGINYTDAYGQYKSEDGKQKEKVDLQASYFYNQTATDNIAASTRWYEEPSNIDTLYKSTFGKIYNHNHRFNARLNWRINEKQSLTIRPSFSYQSNEQGYDAESERVGESREGKDPKYTSTSSLGLREGYNISTSLNYRLSLGETGSLSLGGNFRITDYDSDTESVDSLDVIELEADPDYSNNPYKLVHAPTYNHQFGGYAGLSKRYDGGWTTNVTYRISYNHQETEKSTYDTDSSFTPTVETFNTSSSTNYISDYYTHKIGPGFRFSKGKTNISGSLNYQYSTLGSDMQYKGNEDRIDQAYENLVYNLSGRISINPQNSIRIDVSSYTSNPSVSRLQPSYNTNNDEYISRGNPDLVPSYSQRMFLRYIRSSVNKGRTFMIMGYAQTITNYVANQVSYSPGEMTIDDEVYNPEEFSMPMNMDGYWRFYSKMSYGMPLNFIKCNLNLSAGVNYIITPSMLGGTFDQDLGTLVGGEVNQTDKITYNSTVMLGSNISENCDFTLSWSGYYNEATNTASESLEKNKYFDHTASGTVKLLFLRKFTYTGSVSYTQNMGVTQNYDVNYLVCNMFLGRKVMRKNRGEIFIGVNDLFDQSTDFKRTIGSSYSQNLTNSVVGRFFSAQFAYNLRVFGDRESRKEAERIDKSLRL